MTPPPLIIIQTHRNVVRFVACRRGPVGIWRGREGWRGNWNWNWNDGDLRLRSLEQYFTLTPRSDRARIHR